jgi:hypothetical protein
MKRNFMARSSAAARAAAYQWTTVFLHEYLGHLPFHRRLHSFLDSNYLVSVFSSASSAYIRLSFAFSASSFHPLQLVMAQGVPAVPAPRRAAEFRVNLRVRSYTN